MSAMCEESLPGWITGDPGLVSVIVPVFNMGESLVRCVESVLSQDYPSLEMILVDDGSTDDTPTVCTDLASRDERVRVVRQGNSGPGPARNRGMREAVGEWVMFPDADDELAPSAISSMVAAGEGCDLVVAGFESVRSGGARRVRAYPRTSVSGEELRARANRYIGGAVELGINGAPWNKLFRLGTARENGVEFPPLRRHQDTAFLYRFLDRATRVAFVPGVVYVHYLNDLRDEWAKYPLDYIDSVNGLYEVEEETVLSWNPDNLTIRGMLLREYCCSAVKAMELCYSPKVALDRAGRKAMVEDVYRRSLLGTLGRAGGLDPYHGLVAYLVGAGYTSAALSLMRLKVAYEKSGHMAALRG